MTAACRSPALPYRRPQPRSTWWPWALVLPLLWIGWISPARAQTLVFTQAQAVSADTEHFPELPQVRSVNLPDDWAESRPDQGGPVWYRLTFDAEALRASGELLALYIERACSAVAIRLNGRLVHLSGRLTEPVSRNCQRPQLVALPVAWMQPRNNQLDLKVVGFPLRQVASRQRAGGLSAV